MHLNPYGFYTPEPLSQIECELAAFLHNPPPERGGLGKVEHFWRICAILWGPNNKTKHFVRHPWAERMTIEACSQKWLGISGAGSSGKSDWGAVWGLVNWLAAPKDTLVLVTSTSLKESQKRIWGSIKAYWQAAPGLPGNLVESMGIIRTDDGTGVYNDKQGIALIACEKKNEKEAIGKIIGAKNKRVFLIGDEMPELTEALLTAAVSNLDLNPYFQFIGLGNFKSEYDAFGVFVKPKGGYDTVSVEDDTWETELGLCLHLDGMRSPNITGGKDIWPIYDSKNLAAHRRNLGEDSAMFWRMCRSFHAPIGTLDVLYSDADFLSGGSHDRIPSENLAWLGFRTRVSSLDPSYSNGGDRSVQWFGWYGQLTNGAWVLCYDKYELLRDKVQDKAPRDYQIARQFRDNCIKQNILPQNAAFDATAASSFAAIISEEWSPEVIKVQFGGGTSDMIADAYGKTSKELYDRKVSELWGIGRSFVRAGQLKGMVPELCRELKARKYETRKRGDNVMICVEEKKVMKARIGFSPDIADSALILVHLCRERFGFTPGPNGLQKVSKRTNWIDRANKAHQLYDPKFSYTESPYSPQHAQVA